LPPAAPFERVIQKGASPAGSTAINVEAAAVVRAVLGGGLGRVDLQQDEHGFYLSSADMRGDQKIAACPCPREKPFLL
jgi:hypothetical protein